MDIIICTLRLGVQLIEFFQHFPIKMEIAQTLRNVRFVIAVNQLLNLLITLCTMGILLEDTGFHNSFSSSADRLQLKTQGLAQ